MKNNKSIEIFSALMTILTIIVTGFSIIVSRFIYVTRNFDNNDIQTFDGGNNFAIAFFCIIFPLGFLFFLILINLILTFIGGYYSKMNVFIGVISSFIMIISLFLIPLAVFLS